MSENEQTLDVERVRRERDLYRRLLELGGRESLDPFLREALELVVEVTGVQQAYLELRDPESGDPQDYWSMSLGFSETEVSDIQSNLSSGIIAEALATGETIATHSALLDDRFSARESVQRGQIEAVLCAPVGASAAQGVVYLQGRQHSGPFSPEDCASAEFFAQNLGPLADRLLVRRRAQAAEDTTRDLRERYELGQLVGHGAAMGAALRESMLAAPLDVNVLLTGASGTGKTAFARVIHANSRRCSEPFVEINCASLPETLIESELFGAKAGSHSTAHRDINGKVSAAEGGTLFLDEVGELPAEAQAKLLQLLQSKQYYPLGATQAVQADVRLIAASNADLEERVREKLFREDLLYRLNVLPVRLPSLSERVEDLPELASTMCRRAVERHSLPPVEPSPSTLRAVSVAEWPGNIRQLENAMESGAIRTAGRGANEVMPHDVFPGREEGADDELELESFQDATRRFQRELLERTLAEANWNVSEAARRLDLARSYVYELIRAFGLKRGQ